MKSISLKVSLLSLLCFGALSYGKKGVGPNEQDWGFIKVKENGHMFWWLHFTTANVTSHYDRPLVIWLQGGPGMPSSGFGNFKEIGPLDADLKKRKHTWIKNVNVLFVDSPVGTGFSYVENNDTGAYVTNNQEVTADFMVFLKEFFRLYGRFSETPLYLFGESYGGKMIVDIAVEIDKEVKANNIKCNLKGVGLGDAWISPNHHIRNYPPYLYYLGLIDEDVYEAMIQDAETIADLSDQVHAHNVTEKDTQTFRLMVVSHGLFINFIDNVTHGINFYNILSHTQDVEFKSELDHLMNGHVRKTLKLNHTYNTVSMNVRRYMFEDFMVPVTDQVEYLLNSTNIKVCVYNGQLDLITNTPGTLKWIRDLKWNDINRWKATPRKPILIDDLLQGYQKIYGNLEVYLANNAGHSVPIDNPAAMNFILQKATDNWGLGKGKTEK